MWSILFGYPSPFGAALVERLVVLLTAGPWLILLVAAAPKPSSRRGIGLRVLVLVVVFDLFMMDFRLWAPIAAILAAVWPLGAARLAARRTAAPAVIGSVGLGWLAVGAILAVVTANLGVPAPIRYVVLLFVTFGLLGFRLRSGAAVSSGQPNAPADESPDQDDSGGLARAILFAVGTLPLYWAIPEPTRERFPHLLLAGALGWVGVQFLSWRIRQAAPRRRSGMRAATWASGLLAGMLISLVVAEGYFRYIYDASDANGGLRTSQRWGERHVRFNSWGYRDREIPPAEVRAGLTRIILLGDSFAFGWGIAQADDLLGPRLERALTGRISPPPRVFTLAKGGLDTRQERAMFERDGVRLEPQAVVLTYHLNDIDGLLPPPPVATQRSSLAWQPLTDNSDFIQFFHWHAYLRFARSGSGLEGIPGLAAYRDAETFGRQAGDLLALIEQIRATGAAPAVVLYPYLNGPVKEGPQRYALDRVAGVLGKAGVPVIDVTSLVNVNERRYHANPFDPHPSPALHEAVVPALADMVEQILKDRPATAPATAPTETGSTGVNSGSGGGTPAP